MKERFVDSWKFCLQTRHEERPTAPDWWARDYDDSAWRTVQLPHDWAVDYPFERRYSSGTAYLCGGTGWYRTHFVLPAGHAHDRVRLCFDGVYKHCKVWCNGYYLGSHQNGYTAFSVDLTETLKTDGSENVVAVQVRHPDYADSRWYTGSGIMRPVYLQYATDACFADGGVFFSAPEAETGRFTVQAEVLLPEGALSSPDAPPYEVELTLSDPEGTCVHHSRFPVGTRNGNVARGSGSGTVSTPRLWSAETPALYRLRAVLFHGDSLCDEWEDRVGFRTIRFDADNGFFCNGGRVTLRGVCVHEDAGALGSAVPAAVWRRRLSVLKEAGCNAIRMSHNPHSRELYALCDELGFFVMDELYDEWANPKNKWVTGHNVYPPSHQGIAEDFFACYAEDCRSLVESHRNHPSVILWSIGNEIDYPNDPYCSPRFAEMTGNNDASKPAAERQYNPNHPDISQLPRLAALLAAEIKKHDTTRPVTMALAFPELSADTGVFAALDVAGYNYKESLYEADHAAHPGLPFLGSENSHSLEAWRAVTAHAYIAGQFLWTGVDYLGEAKGWPVHASPAGLLDMAGFAKPQYFFRKSLWTDEPFVALCTAPAESEPDWNGWSAQMAVQGWNYAPAARVRVTAFTNAARVRFCVNGVVRGEAEKGADGTCTVELPFEPGTLLAEALAPDGSPLAQDTLVTAGAACALSVQTVPDAEVTQLLVHAVDGAGIAARGDSSLVFVTVEGGAELLALENGDIADVTECRAPYRMLHNGRLAVYVRNREPGAPVRVMLQGRGLAPAVVEYCVPHAAAAEN